jgi:hypothetical protein
MEYPGSKLTRPIRLALLITFIAAFFIISPLVIIFSAGFRFDIKNGLLRETGSLSVDVIPESTSVYLDGLKIDQKMPIRLNNITPHKYILRLSAPGYYEWEKIIEINNNQTTYIKGLILIKKSPPVNISKEKVGAISVSPSGKFLAYTIIGKNETEVIIRDNITGAKSTAVTIPSSLKMILTWSPNGYFLAVSTEQTPYKLINIINAATPYKSQTLGLHNNLTVNKYIWSNDAEPKFYFENDGQIRSYLPRLDQSSTLTSSTFQDWYVYEGLLWTIDYNTSTDGLEIISDTLGFKNNFFTIKPTESVSSSSLKAFKLSSVNKKTAVLSDHNSNKYYIVTKDRYYSINGNQMLYSKYNNWLLIWTPWEFWTYSEGDEPYLLNRSGDELNNVVPLDQFNTLAMIWENNVTVLHPYFFTQRTIIDGAVNSLSVDTETRHIYYSNNEGIWKLSY